MYFRNLIWIDSGLAPGAARPLITFESLDGMRNEICEMVVPVTSHQLPVTLTLLQQRLRRFLSPSEPDGR